MKQLDKNVVDLLKTIMLQCKRERKAKTKLSNKQLAGRMGITENYLSAFESARAIPSLQTFLQYLKFSGFDVSPLKNLEIRESESLRPIDKDRAALIARIYTLEDDQVGYLKEQLKIAELFDLRIKTKLK